MMYGPKRIETTTPGRRSGFTLVELLVAAAVSIVLMVIITGAFQQGIDMFRKLRSQGQMQERMRITSTTLRDDLSWQHFLPQSSQFGDGSGPYGDSKLNWVAGQDLTKADTTWKPPADGFFRILNAPEQNVPAYAGLSLAQTPPFVLEGTDNGSLTYTRSTRHALHFTVLRQGNGLEHMFHTREQRLVTNPAGGPPVLFPSQSGIQPSYIDPPTYREPAVFSTRWAEVAYFLAYNGESANGVPMFNLYRRQKLLLPPPPPPAPPPPTVPPPTNIYGGGGPQVATNYVVAVDPTASPQFNLEISTRTQFPTPGLAPTQQFYNRAGSVTQPRNRFGMLPAHQLNDPAVNPTYRNLAGLFQQVPNLPVGEGPRYTTIAEEVLYPPYVGNAIYENQASNDLLLQDVLSFEVKAYWTGNPPPRTTYTVPVSGGGTMVVANSDYPFDYIPLTSGLNDPMEATNPVNRVLLQRGLRVFDTWSHAANSPYAWVDPLAPPPSAGMEMWKRQDAVANPDWTAARLPLRINVKAVLIRIRIWDFRTEQTRQITIIQDV